MEENTPEVSQVSPKTLTPKCGFCGTDPIRVAMALSAVGAPPGQNIPVMQSMFCANCRSIISTMIIGELPPTVSGASVEQAARLINKTRR